MRLKEFESKQLFIKLKQFRLIIGKAIGFDLISNYCRNNDDLIPNSLVILPSSHTIKPNLNPTHPLFSTIKRYTFRPSEGARRFLLVFVRSVSCPKFFLQF